MNEPEWLTRKQRVDTRLRAFTRHWQIIRLHLCQGSYITTAESPIRQSRYDMMVAMVNLCDCCMITCMKAICTLAFAAFVLCGCSTTKPSITFTQGYSIVSTGTPIYEPPPLIDPDPRHGVSADGPMAFEFVSKSSLTKSIEEGLQEFGFSLNPPKFHRELLRSSGTGGTNGFWTDFVSLDEELLPKLKLTREDLLLSSNLRVIYNCQVVGAWRFSRDDALHEEIGFRTMRLEMAFVLKRRGLKGRFVYETGEYRSKAILDGVFATIKARADAKVREERFLRKPLPGTKHRYPGLP